MKEILTYDNITGEFRWRVRDKVLFNQKMKLDSWNRKYAGTVATSSDGRGYLLVSVGRYPFKAHRLAYLYMTGCWPDDQMDHISGDRSDNSWGNLRVVSTKENGYNQRVPSNNTSGIIGVFWMKDRLRWKAQIKVDGVGKVLGTYKDFFEACCSRKSAERRYGFHINHGKT